MYTRGTLFFINNDLILCGAQVGNIYQKFSSPEEGRVQNIIQLSVAGLTVADRGATFTVDATYDVRSDSRIALVFNAASLGERTSAPGLPPALPTGIC